MGLQQSVPILADAVVEESRNDAFSLWPGLDYHLELSFNSLDPDKRGSLSYATLEPVLRHHLMQIGLIEYVTRFATPEGKLQTKEVSHFLKEYGIDLKKNLDQKDWKNLMLAWIRRVLDAQNDDVRIWQTSLRKMQDEQSEKYQHAMKQFQKHYIEQLEGYYKSVEEAHKEEEAYRQEWEASLGVQDEFFNTQMEFLQARQAAAEAMANKQMESETVAEHDIMKHITTGREYLPGNIIATTFAYPTSVTTTGAPVSGGAQIPSRRPVKRGRKGVCC